jgi:hypothetical protein
MAVERASFSFKTFSRTTPKFLLRVVSQQKRQLAGFFMKTKILNDLKNKPQTLGVPDTAF